MTSSFRRSTVNKTLSTLQKEHDTILNEISHMEDTTDNNSIMDVINPVFKDLDMNNKNIDNANNINTLTVNNGVILTDPLSSDFDMGNHKINNLSEIKTTTSQLRIVGQRLILETTSYATDIEVSNSINMYGRDINNVNYVKSNTTQTNNINVDTITPHTGTDINITCPGTIHMNSFIDYNGNFNDYNGGGIYNLKVVNLDSDPTNPVTYGGLRTNKITSALGNDVNMDGKNYNNMNNIQITGLSHPTGGNISCNNTTLNNIGNLQVDISGVIDVYTVQNVANITSYSGQVDFNNSSLVNVNTLEVKEIKDHYPYKSISSGLEVNKDGRYNIKVITQSTTPVLLFKFRYLHFASVYEGRFMSVNDTQSKIWCAPAVCTVWNSQIDKNIGGSGVSSIGGTTRASTIDFTINNYVLEIWVTPNFSDYTISLFDFNIWTDYPQ